MDKVWMQSPKGEVEEVDATPEVLGPLMAKGWRQTWPQAAEAPKAETKKEAKKEK